MYTHVWRGGGVTLQSYVSMRPWNNFSNRYEHPRRGGRYKDPKEHSTLTNTAVGVAVLIITGYTVWFAVGTKRHEFHERCLADHDHDHHLPMSKGCPKELNAPRLSFAKRQIEIVHFPFYLKLVWGGSIIPLFFTMTFLSLWVLLNLAKPRLVESKKAVALVLFITLVITLVFHLGVYVLFADFLDYEPNVS
jgi:hypothetical protein